MIIKAYTPDKSQEWDQFVQQTRNGTFMHLRSYMDYHADRFEDASLMVYDNDKLVAMLPASKHNNMVASHGGLTYGGLLVARKLSASKTLEICQQICAYYQEVGFEKLRYKAIPYIYHTLPSQDDLYAMFRLNAQRVRVDLSSTIDIQNKPAYSKGRKHSIAKAKKWHFNIQETTDFDTYFAIVGQRLADKYDTVPTHSAQEMALLQERHPKNIKLYAVYNEEVMEAGVLVYITDTCTHAQYMAATDFGRENGALDLAVDHAIKQAANKRYLDFGISTEEAGQYLNTGLLRQKEMFGSQTTVYETYELLLS